MSQLKLVAAQNEMPVVLTGETIGSNERMAQLLADLDRAWGGTDRELGARAAKCIRELMQQKEHATALMLESSALLKHALGRLHALRALI